MRRREFLSVLSGAAVWPLTARAQQPTMPVVGWLHPTSLKQAAQYLSAFRKGLSEGGYVEGRNVAIEYRWAEGQYERLPALAGELVRLPVALIFAGTPPAAVAAKVATTSIPIVFTVGFDPVAAGLVASFSHPGGNATGMTLLTGPLVQKRLEFLRELIPNATNIAMLVNPTGPDTPPEIRDAQAAAQAYGVQIKLLNATTASEIDAAFTSLGDLRPDALIVGSDPFFVARTEQFTAQATRAKIPAVYPFGEFTTSGGG